MAPEVISSDCIEVETVEYHTSGGPSTTATTAAEEIVILEGKHRKPLVQCGASSSSSHHLPYVDVHTIDTFARSRIVNFVRRTDAGRSPTTSVFNVRRTDMQGAPVVTATCRLTLPEPHRSYVAEGVAEDPKDAEILAAMHAEHVCDSLGVPLFRLPSMQKRHAANARAQGRYAPMPGDAVKPVGTAVPPPFRMVPGLHRRHPAAATAAPASPTEEAEATRSEPWEWAPAESLTTLSEAQLVPPSPRRCQPVHVGAPEPSVATPPTRVSAAAAATPPATSMDLDTPTGLVSSDEEEVWHPWVPSGHRTAHATTVATSSHSSRTGADAFDPTEGGLWQMVNTVSMRCSPTPEDALVLPCVFDPRAEERLKDHFLQKGQVLKDRVSHSHVLVPGFSKRVYVAEIRLSDTTAVTAKGKAQSPELATQLAAMHAELILDAMGLPLFPKDDARQARHAAAVADYGRWAPNPVVGDTVSPCPHAAFPLPLKQQTGGDDVWLDHAVLFRGTWAHTRSDGERIINLQNDINTACGDCVEVNPPEELLEEAMQLLRVWQRDIARNPYPSLFVVTKMGDYFRATTVTPVPHRHGVRGGNAIGRTIDQAIKLCALHAIDTLSSLGVPLFRSADEQAQYMAVRHHLGQVTPLSLKGMTRPRGLVGIVKPTMAKVTEDSAAEGHTQMPYLPGYLVEGQGKRWLPHIEDTLHILQLRIPDDFEVCGAGVPDDAMQSMGNTAKTCVQNYLRHQDVCRRNRGLPHFPTFERLDLPPTSAATTPEAPAESQAVEDAMRAADRDHPGVRATVRRWLTACPTHVNPSIYITGYGSQVSVHNIAYLRMPIPLVMVRGEQADGGAAPTLSNLKAPSEENATVDASAEVGASETASRTCSTATVISTSSPSLPLDVDVGHVLAVGISLKKKDAERMCYLHAAALLLHYGEDVIRSFRVGLPRTGCAASMAEVMETVVNRTKNGTPLESHRLQQQEHEEAGRSTSTVSTPPPPFLHSHMKSFLDSGRHHTPAKRRPVPGPYHPF